MLELRDVLQMQRADAAWHHCSTPPPILSQGITYDKQLLLLLLLLIPIMMTIP